MAEDYELVQYMTQRFVNYLETPREERNRISQERKLTKEPWQTRWFGMIPMSITLFANKRKR